MYALRPGLNFCMADGTAVFLDAPRNRYFALTPNLSQSFLALIDVLAACLPIEELDARPFVDRGILVCTATSGSWRDGPIPLPRRQWCANPNPRTRTKLRHKMLALYCILITLARLQTQGFEKLIRPKTRRHRYERDLPVRAFDAFRAVIRVIPCRLKCLPASLALRSYLAALGFQSDLIIGVSMKPFAAHCWVQDGDMVIGDTLERVQGFTPIRRVP